MIYAQWQRKHLFRLHERCVLGLEPTPGILAMCSFGLFNRYMYYLLKNDLQSILGKETKS